MPRRYYGPIQVKPSLHKIRKRLAESQRWKCYWCGGKIKVYKDRNYYPDELVLDHKVHKSEGGSDSEENLVAACKICSQLRSGTLPPEKFRHLVPPQPLMDHQFWSYSRNHGARDDSGGINHV
jgi:5-methylcytosine-specific restriction endonuclease McrA